jgi:hypothetical protein
MKFSVKKIVPLFFGFAIICWCNLCFAQTNYDTTNVEIVAPVEESSGDSVVAVVDTTNEYSIGQFVNIDSIEINPIAYPRKSLQDTIAKLKQEDAYWYAEGVDLVKPLESNKDGGFWYWLARLFNSSAMRIIAWVVVIGIVLTLVVLFLKNNGIGLFTAAARKIYHKEEETISDNIFEIDFEKNISQSIYNQNYKLATRLLFLRLLKTMTEKEVLSYSLDKTNFDYLMALHGKKIFADFASAVRNYEYVWYGNFAINAVQFEAIKTNFDKLQQEFLNN